MPITVKDLHRIGSFTLPTRKLGPLKIWSYTAGAAQRLMEGTFRNEFKTSGEKLRLLVKLIGTHLNIDDPDERGRKLSTRDINKISGDEIDVFAEQFLQKHPELYTRNRVKKHDTQSYDLRKADFPKRPEENDTEYLERTLDEYQRRSMASIFSSFSSGLAEMFKRNIDLSAHVRTLANEIKLPQSAVRTTLPAAIGPSPLRRMDEMVDALNSLAELNRESVNLVASLNDLGLAMAAESAQNARQTKTFTYIALAIAVASLVLSTIFSILNYASSSIVNILIEQISRQPVSPF
jgi:hypothetical protein